MFQPPIISSSTDWLYSGSSPPSRWLVWSKMYSLSSRGMPIMSQMIRSGIGAATSVTKSHEPFAATSRTTSLAMSWTYSSMRATIRGVKPLLTRRRSFVCRGASMLIIEPRSSLISAGKSGMLTPLPEMNRSGCRRHEHDVVVLRERSSSPARRGSSSNSASSKKATGLLPPEEGEGGIPLVLGQEPELDGGQVDVVSGAQHRTKLDRLVKFRRALRSRSREGQTGRRSARPARRGDRGLPGGEARR